VAVALLAAFLPLPLFSISMAQTATHAKPAAATRKSSKARKRAAKPQPAAAVPVAAAETQPAAQPQPETPAWPANERPSPARVTWDASGLRVEAQNSSLEQILREVSTATGAKIEGFSADQRVFGVYGPGKARDVISALLVGAGYNVLMYGDLGMGAPSQIVLASSGKDEAKTEVEGGQQADGDADAGDDDEVVEEQPEQPVQPPVRPGLGPGGQPRTPQQIMQEMQQRQQQQQQQQQTQPPQ
jgi:hypothetical protein